MDAYRFRQGRRPLLVSMPHVGTQVPQELAARMTPEALRLPDTDWHLEELYDFLEELGAHVIVATQSRYLVDLNRDPAGRPLYPGASNTELCPTSTFGEAPIYKDSAAPTAAEVAERRRRWWQPYHDKITATLQELQAEHGQVLLWDAHSIRSRVPRFFEGQLPDLNLGTGGGITASPALLQAVARVGQRSGYSQAVDGRFKGGYITRHYGQPEQGVQAIQLELSWATYMEEDYPFRLLPEKASAIRPVLRRMMEAGMEALESAG
ncbi:MAG TPA: N-formylglutamate deformylase [Kiloniellales bacterium]|nr:N-formylglutamate deformylase [Kiloniellales bacterium]